MIKKLLFLSFNFSVLIFNFSFSQPSIQWQKCLGGTGPDYAYSIEQTFDGGYIVAGVSHSNDGDVSGHHGSPNHSDSWIAKLDFTGSIQWQKSLGGTETESPFCVQVIKDGYIIAGTTASYDGDVSGNHGGTDWWIVKLDTTGNIQWQKCFGGTSVDKAYSIIQTLDEGYLAAGSAMSNNGDVTGNHGGEDFWIVKLDSAGNLLWQKALGGTDGEEAHDIIQTIDGGYIVTGITASNDGDVSGNHGGLDIWVVKLDSTGSIQWQKCLGGMMNENSWSIRQAPDGSYCVAGATSSFFPDNHGSSDYWIVKLDSVGNSVWQKCFGGYQVDVAHALGQTQNGDYFVAGYSSSIDGDVTGSNGSTEFWAVKVMSNGTLDWQKCLGGSAIDYGYGGNLTSDGGYILTGSVESNNGNVSGNHGDSDYWVVKLGPDAVGIEEENDFNHFDIFPNPFHEQAIIKFNQQLSEGILYFYNIFGEIVFEKSNITGTETVLNAESLSCGVYALKIIEKGKTIYAGKAIIY